MYKIEKKDFGFKLTFDGFIKEEEMRQWVEESKKTLASAPAKFGVFVDMRNLKPLAPATQAIMEDGQKIYKQKGMQRSVVIVDKSVTKMQFQRLARESGIYEWERYLSSAEDASWEQDGINWIAKGIDPD